MNKSIYFYLITLLFCLTIQAQVGIGTTAPKSTFDVKGDPNNTLLPDGIQVPSLTITELEGKVIAGAYGVEQDGAIIFISDASIGSTISATAEINTKGFYFYNHNGTSGTWRVLSRAKVDMTNPDRIPRWDGTNLIDGSIIDSGGNIGIGTLTPDALLDVEGTFQLKNGTEGESKLLTSDENGNASWRDFSAANLFGQGNLSVSNFSCLSMSGSLNIGGFPTSIEVSGNYAYVVDEGSDDLKVIDITNPAAPIVSGSLALGSQPKSISLAGNYAYVVDSGSDDLKVIDISNPSAPSIASSLGVGSSPVSVTVAGNYAFVVDQDSDDLKVIDITNPVAPSLSGSLGLGSIPQSISVEGNYAYVVDSGSNDLKVIDISDKTAPTLSGSLALANSPAAIELVGSYVYIIDRSSNDLKIIDISNPAAPSLTGSLVLGVVPKDLKVVGNYAFVVSDFSSDLRVIEISDPALPSLVGSLDLGTGNRPSSVTVLNGYAYIVDVISDDLKIINLSCQMTYNPFSNNVELITAQPYIWTVNGNSINNLNMGNVGIGTENPSSKLDVVGDINSYSLNTGQGANELYAMNQNVRTNDIVSFAGINTGPGLTEVHLMNQNMRNNDNVVFNTVNTGQGANELLAHIKKLGRSYKFA